MIWMEKQLEALTDLVKELTRERTINEQQMSNRTDNGMYYTKGNNSFLIEIVSSKLAFISSIREAASDR